MAWLSLEECIVGLGDVRQLLGLSQSTGSMQCGQRAGLWQVILLFGIDVASWMQIGFFFFNLARALGFTHSGGCESQTALPPVQSLPVKTVWDSWTGQGWDFFSCLCGVWHSLELSLWVLHHLRVLPSLTSRFQSWGETRVSPWWNSVTISLPPLFTEWPRCSALPAPYWPLRQMSPFCSIGAWRLSQEPGLSWQRRTPKASEGTSHHRNHSFSVSMRKPTDSQTSTN